MEPDSTGQRWNRAMDNVHPVDQDPGQPLQLRAPLAKPWPKRRIRPDGTLSPRRCKPPTSVKAPPKYGTRDDRSPSPARSASPVRSYSPVQGSPERELTPPAYGSPQQLPGAVPEDRSPLASGGTTPRKVQLASPGNLDSGAETPKRRAQSKYYSSAEGGKAVGRQSVIAALELELLVDENEKVDPAALPLWDSRSLRFNSYMGIVIALNVVNLSLQVNANHADEAQQDEGMLNFTRRAEYAFVMVFTAEAILRFRCEGGLKMLRAPWNAFDATVLLIAYLDITVSFLAASGDPAKAAEADPQKSEGGGLFAQLSSLRMMRLFRLFRLIRLVKELYLIMSGFVNSFRALMWTCVLIAVMIWGGAIMMTEGVGNSQCCYHEQTYLKDERFGSIMMSALTLFQVMTQDSWCSMIAHPVIKEKSHYSLFFILFVMITAFGMMNMLIAVIVEAVQKVSLEKDSEKTRGQTTRNVKTLSAIFGQFKPRGEDDLTHEQFARAFASPGVMQFLQDMAEEAGGVFPDKLEVQELFEALDIDGSGTISEEEFTSGLMRCCQNRPIDGASDHFRLRRLEDKMDKILTVVAVRFERIQQQLDARAGR